MTKIPTAKQFLTKDFNTEPGAISSTVWTDAAVKAMIEFAQLHVKKCKSEIAKRAKVDVISLNSTYPSPGGHIRHKAYCIDKQSIINIYPLNKII